MKRLGGVCAGALALALSLIVDGFRATPYNNFVLLADAFVHGRVWIDWPGPYIDALPFAGRHYIIEAPLPAVLLVPVVLLRGTAANQSWLAALLGGVATFAGWEICLRLGTSVRARIALCGFLLLGTDLFWCATFGDVWFIAHVASVAFTLLALLELLGRGRGWLVALCAACAVESRFSMVLALPVYAGLLAFGTGLAQERSAPKRAVPKRAAELRSLAAFALTLVPFVVLWVAYNEARWHVPYDLGYTAWYHQDSAGSPYGSPFQLRYFGYQVRSFFVQLPEFGPIFPYVVPSLAGVALTWTSPALLAALLARGPWRVTLAMWLATLLTAAPNFIYYVDGYAQFGMRHALDFEPFLFVLMALALRRPLALVWRALCAAALGYSILVGAWGVWFWRVVLRH